MADDIVMTPMMKQYFDLKAKHPDAVLLFRCGDFYETYSSDAVAAAEILGIALTRRGNGKGKTVEMAGFPHHALDTYLPKLIRAGKRVAICDQLEDPKLAKKLVKRGITELVTPGVSINDNVLDNKENNFLAAIHFAKPDLCGIAFLDISTGEFLLAEGGIDETEKLINSFMPKEILYERGKKEQFEAAFGNRHITFELDDWIFTETTAMERLTRHFEVNSLKGFGVDKLHNGIIASGAIIEYLVMTQHTNLRHITSLRRIEEDRYVRLDKFTIRSLELIHSMNDDGMSLLDAIDRTVTAMGARMMRRWIVFPLKGLKPVTDRLSIVGCLKDDTALRTVIDDNLHMIADLERIISKAAVGRISPREVVQLKTALTAIKPIKEACAASGNQGLVRLSDKLNVCESICSRIDRELVDDPPLMSNKGGIIKKGVDAELDELRRIAYSGKDYLLQLQKRETEATGISSLKIGYNNVFGYYIEVRNTHKDKVPAGWIRKQTLVNAERYITEELKEYEEKILGAEDKIIIIENRIYGELVSALSEFIPVIQVDASTVATIDCLMSFASVAAENGYVCPEVDQSETIDIKGGRHPVIERQLPLGESYVPNDVYLDTDSQQIMIITGPNMAGKSALLRQTALIVLLAQIGSFVPAQSARIGLVDKIFTRVGASDNISLGESTFMVEMNEASNILNNVSQRSLVLFDELGRGTSTYDGISIAWAIVEYLHENSRAHARTLFATHYHELNEMAGLYKRIRNYNVSVKEAGNKVIFLRRLVEGGSEHSFGIHVAKMAGMPKVIVQRAQEILQRLENDNVKGNLADRESLRSQQPPQRGMQLNLFQLDDPVLARLRDDLLSIDLDNLTPLEALNRLSEMKSRVK